ncbi:hypothetical protein O181_115585 [Austropuccinia psidii MF-1]|uniref:Uncharacterized protein n=1 Tax=Austropuccinia psidii MF-1 TaxID=1389203 RepID=A0A9Q3PWL9_9BASI|nr:hypothetical protein [Austropuccinia psidii MF-1]
MCGRKGFKLISLCQVPTFLGATGHPSTIDLTWPNHNVGKLQITMNFQLNNHSLDHQTIVTTINIPRDNLVPAPKLLVLHRKKLDQRKFCESLSLNLQALAIPMQGNHQQQLERQVESPTKIIKDSMEEQGKWVTTNNHRMKPWWNTTILSPLV